MDTTSHHQGPALPPPAPVAMPAARRWGRLLPAGVLIGLVGLLAVEMLPRGQRPVELAETTPAVKPTVSAVQVVTPKRSTASSELL